MSPISPKKLLTSQVKYAIIKTTKKEKEVKEMFEIKKEKNLLYFTREGKTWKFDINTGTFYGLRGTPIKSYPARFWTDPWLNFNLTTQLLKDLHNYNYSIQRCLDYLAITDTLDSLGVTKIFYTISDLQNIAFDKKLRQKFFKVLTEDKNFFAEKRVACFIRDYKFESKLAKYHIVINDHFTKEMAELTIHLIDGFRRELTKQEIEFIKYYIEKGYLEVLSVSHLHTFFEKYFFYAKALNKKLVKGDFMRSYVEYKRTYKLHQEEIENEQLKFPLAYKEKLEFSNEKYEVIIPLTKQEYLNEGESQGNCVARLYMPKVMEQKTLIVFIRDKEHLDKSLITCEVDLKGNIVQFLKNIIVGI